jgi:methylglyoxal synthase
MTRALGLIAHDQRKAALIDWARRHRAFLATCRLVATGNTGRLLMEALPELRVECLKSGPLGGDQQIGARIAEGTLDALIFFIDPLSALPHDVDVKALLRLGVVYDLPLATNAATADCLMAGWQAGH